MKLKDKVETYLKTMKTHTFGDVCVRFPEIPKASLKGIYYRYKKKESVRYNSELRANLAEPNFEGSNKVKLEVIEPLIARQLAKGYDQQVIRLGLDLIKLKQVDKGIDDEIDISKYIKKAKEVLEAIES